MMNRNTFTRAVITVVVALGLSTPALAAADGRTPSSLERSSLNTLLAETPDPAAADRAAVHDFLDDASTLRVARGHDLDLKKAHEVVDTLDGEDLNRIVESIDELQDELVGGDRLVIGSGALIVILLVLLILAAD